MATTFIAHKLALPSPRRTQNKICTAKVLICAHDCSICVMRRSQEGVGAYMSAPADICAPCTCTLPMLQHDSTPVLISAGRRADPCNVCASSKNQYGAAHLLCDPAFFHFAAF